MIELLKIHGAPPDEKGWKPRRDSFSRLWIGYPDGKTLTFHSYDWPGSTSKVRDQALGIARFERLLTKPLYNGYSIARIYDARTGQIIHEYKHGCKVL